MAHAPPGISDADTSALVSLLIRAGYCVRIANDLSSEERDHSGHEVNAVPLMAEKYSCPSSLARRALRQLLRREMGRLFDEARTVSPAIANPYGGQSGRPCSPRSGTSTGAKRNSRVKTSRSSAVSRARTENRHGRRSA